MEVLLFFHGFSPINTYGSNPYFSCAGIVGTEPLLSVNIPGQSITRFTYPWLRGTTTPVLEVNNPLHDFSLRVRQRKSCITTTLMEIGTQLAVVPIGHP